MVIRGGRSRFLVTASEPGVLGEEDPEDPGERAHSQPAGRLELAALLQIRWEETALICSVLQKSHNVLTKLFRVQAKQLQKWETTFLCALK